MKKYIWILLLVVLVGGLMTGKALNNSYALPVQEQVVSAWAEFDDDVVWAYSSADSPTFVASVNADVTGLLSAGMRVRLSQTTVKYFIVTAVGSYSGGVTLITMYGGTDYTLADAAISDVGWSSHKAPFGFPLNPDKWTVEVVDTSLRQQASPVSGTWYNLGTTNTQISIPIGVWDVSYQVAAGGGLTLLTSNVYVTLSTADNSESNSHLTVFLNIGSSADSHLIEGRLTASDIISAASKTTYYLNAKTGTTSVPDISFGGSTIPTIIRAVCAYL